MVRNVYRCYLYVVYLALVIFAAIGLGRLLQVLFTMTALRGSSGTLPSSQELVQALVFAIVSWVIAGSLGGLHFWLIRRDMRTDPAGAGGGAVRAFFLNATLAWITYATAFIGAYALFPLLGGESDVSVQLAFVLTALAVLVLLEWDRQRLPATSSVALVFQRLHFYGIQLLLLVLFIANWWQFISMDLQFIAGALHLSLNSPYCSGSCMVPTWIDVLKTFGSVAWVGLFWLGYGWIMRRDTTSLLRYLGHFLSLAVGFGLGIAALKLGIDLVLLAISGHQVALADVVGPQASYNFISPLTAGIIIIGVYGYWLRFVVRSGALQRPTVLLISEALLTISLAATFWVGVGFLLFNLLELWFAATVIPVSSWTSALALMMAGVAYLPLDFHLYRRTGQLRNSGPRRGFLFALLGGGTVSLAVGASIALYAVGTTALGSPLSDWPHIARIGLAAFLVGAVVVGFYFWRFRHEYPASDAEQVPVAPLTPSIPVAEDTHALATVSEASAGEATAALPGSASEAAIGSLERILEALQTGKISREEALKQIQALLPALSSGQTVRNNSQADDTSLAVSD